MASANLGPGRDGHNVYFFCDESSYQDRYVAVGGIATSAPNLRIVREAVRSAKRDAGVTGEVKWTNAKSRRICVHTELIRLLRSYIDQNVVHLHVLFAPFHLYGHRRSGPGKRASTTSKMHYQLLLHRALRFYGKAARIHIRPDNGHCTEEILKFEDRLRSQAVARYSSRRDCIASLLVRDSRDEPMLELLDVTLGAFAALRNERDIGAVKQRIANVACEVHQTFDFASDFSGRQFSIWNVRPGG